MERIFYNCMKCDSVHINGRSGSCYEYRLVIKGDCNYCKHWSPYEDNKVKKTAVQ